MNITLKLYAGLMRYLPSDAKEHAFTLTIEQSETTYPIVYHYPHEYHT